jgi:DNA-binding transcriptional regulator YhcF (GntR family)
MARFDGGWVKAWRKVAGSDLVDNVWVWGLWHWLLYSAAYKPSKAMVGGKQIEIRPGMVVFGLKELAEKWGCSKTTIRKWVNYLRDTQRIAVESRTGGYIVTIQNWELYQSSEPEPLTPSVHEVNDTCTQGVREVTLSEEGKKGRKKSPRVNYPPAFEELYELYPRKEGKTDGFAVYQRVIKTDEDRARLRAAIENYARAKAGTEAQYLRHFDRFMRSWMDWLDPKTGQTNPSINVKPLNLDDLEAG